MYIYCIHGYTCTYYIYNVYVYIYTYICILDDMHRKKERERLLMYKLFIHVCIYDTNGIHIDILGIVQK